MSQRPNSGALFTNSRKSKDNHPDMTGPLNVTCLHCGCENELEQSGWKKLARDGNGYISQSVRAKREEATQHKASEPIRYGDTFHEDFSF